MFRRAVAVVLLMLVGAGALRAEQRPFSFRAGLGYDYLSQRYFTDSLAVVGPDTVLTQLELTSEFLNDLKASLEATYRYSRTSRFDCSGRLEQTQDITRVKLNSYWVRPGQWVDLRWRNQLDWRHQSEDADSGIGSYLSGSSNLKVRHPFSGSTAIWGQGQAEATDFSGDATTGYDFVRLWGKLGLEHSFGFSSVATLNGFVSSRRVADSTTLDYAASGLEGAFSGTVSRLEIDFLARWESKDYNKPEHDDDYRRFEMDSRSKVDLGRQLFSRQQFELEVTSFDPSDPLNDDYSRTRGSLTVGLTLGDLDLAIGPELENLSQTSRDSGTAEGYLETGSLLEINFVSASGLFLSMEHRFGHRSLDQLDEYQSNFRYYEFSSLGSWFFCNHIDLTFLLSANWEWHDRESENNRSILLSSGLSYRF